jgi:hypothetical protein
MQELVSSSDNNVRYGYEILQRGQPDDSDKPIGINSSDSPLSEHQSFQAVVLDRDQDAPTSEAVSRPFWVRHRRFLLPLWGAVYIAVTSGMLTVHLSSSPMSCSASAWGGDCGIDGVFCVAGLPTAWSQVRCASECGVWNINEQYRYRVYGAGPDYAGNSQICPAARHAGLIGANGGPVRFRLTAADRDRFDGGVANGVVAQPLGAFPAALELASGGGGNAGVRWPFLAVTLVLLAFFVLLEPSNGWFYAVTLFAAFIYTQARSAAAALGARVQASGEAATDGGAAAGAVQSKSGG